MRQLEPPTGHVFRRDRVRRATWYAKCRLPDGRPVQKRIGPAWTQRGRPPAGYFTKRTLRTGCAACSTRRGAARCPASCGPARRADAAAEFCATSSTTGPSSPRRSPTTARSSPRTRGPIGAW